MRKPIALWIMLWALLLSPQELIQGERDQKKRGLTREEKLAGEIDELDRLMRDVEKYAGMKPAVLQEAAPILAQARELCVKARNKLATGETQVADRLQEAAEELLEGAEHLANARLRMRWKDGNAYPTRPGEDDRREAAKELERAYFRSAELKFFAQRSGADSVSRLAALSRRFYQEGRAAFDREEFFAAAQLAKASRELSSAVEEYIQARLPEDLPPPPKMPKE